MNQTQYAQLSGLSPGRVSQLVKAGMPLTSREAADQWRGMSARKRKESNDKTSGPYRPPEAQAPVDPGAVLEDTPQGAYERQRNLERAAYDLASKSLSNRNADAARLVAIHAQAARNLTLAREEVLALAEKERRLVSGDWVRKVMTEHDGSVIALAKAMPKMLSGRIAPHDPEHAENELSRWVEDVFLKTLHQTTPWTS